MSRTRDEIGDPIAIDVEWFAESKTELAAARGSIETRDEARAIRAAMWTRVVTATGDQRERYGATTIEQHATNRFTLHPVASGSVMIAVIAPVAGVSTTCLPT